MTQPSLKCVSVRSARRNLCSLVEEQLRVRVPEGEVIDVGENAFIVNTNATAAEVRDWFLEALDDTEAAIVVEFETWSGYGAIDSAWLMRRGH